MATLNDIKRINTGNVLTSEEMADYLNAVNKGQIKLSTVQGIVRDRTAQRKANLDRQRITMTSLGLPPEFVNMYVDAFVKYGDPNIAIADVRQSDKYDTFFPGNKREDGSFRYDEQQYNMVVESYAATLEDYGINPDIYEEKFGELIAGDVAPDEFVGRVQAINDRIVNAPEEVRAAFANEFGIPEASDPAAILGIALAPDIGEQVRERRLSIAQVTGQASRFGFARSRQRVEALMNAGMDPSAAAQFYSGAVPTVNRLAASAGQSGETFGIDQFEDATVMGDSNALLAASRLSAQESARYSRRGSVQSDQTGALTGLQRR